MQSHPKSGFSVIPLAMLLAASAFAWMQLYDVATVFARTAVGG